MALIETTDDFFCSVSKAINAASDGYAGIQRTLDNIYMALTKNRPNNQKSTLLILDTFKEVIKPDTIERLHQFIEETPELELLIQDGKEGVVSLNKALLFSFTG